MPEFNLVPLLHGQVRTAAGTRTRILSEYLSYIARISLSQAGHLVPNEGETALQVRWRIGPVARASGKNIVIRRNGDDVYLWERL